MIFSRYQLLGVWLLAIIAVMSPLAFSEQSRSQVRVLQITVSDEIEPGIAAFMTRILKHAVQQQYDAVLMRINTPGGRLDAALHMKDQLLDAGVPVVALVDRQALSAGALIALAADRLYMVSGGVIGAATPVLAGGAAERASEKIVSATRHAFAAAAEARGRPTELAMAMVDEDVEVEGVVAKGKVLSLTAQQAAELGLIDGVVSGRDELLQVLGWEGATITVMLPTIAERVARFFTNSLVVPLLLTLGTLGLILEIKSPGFGVAGGIGLLCLGLFFWSHHIAGLAGYEAFVLVVVGVLLLLVEAFILPGFGVAGILGVGAILGGVYLTILGDVHFATYDQYLAAAWVVVAALFLVVTGVLLVARYLPATGRMGGLVLSTSAAANQMISSRREDSVAVGDHGVAISDLRPAGFARFGEQRLDVVTEGEYLEKGASVTIVSIFGNRIVVCQRSSEA